MYVYKSMKIILIYNVYEDFTLYGLVQQWKQPMQLQVGFIHILYTPIRL